MFRVKGWHNTLNWKGPKVPSRVNEKKKVSPNTALQNPSTLKTEAILYASKEGNYKAKQNRKTQQQINEAHCREMRIKLLLDILLGYPGGSVVKNPPAGDTGSIPGSGRSLKGGRGNPLHYSCLENPTEPGGQQSMGYLMSNDGCYKTRDECIWCLQGK